MTVSCTVTGLSSGGKFCTDWIKTCVTIETGTAGIIVGPPSEDKDSGDAKDALLVKGNAGAEATVGPGKAPGKGWVLTD